MNTALLAIVLVAVIAVNAQSSLYTSFLENNVDRATRLPLSYHVPVGYFEGIPASERPQNVKDPRFVAACDNSMVPPENLNAYEFQTEQMLTSVGLNLYDGSVWSIANSLLGNINAVTNYTQKTLWEAKTLQFGSIKASAPCGGVQEPLGPCTDPTQSGACGFCYGDDFVSLDSQNAYYFRMISDYYCLMGTTDARCPQLGNPWCWNEYSPVTGENAWATMIGTLQSEYIKQGNVQSISAVSQAVQLAIRELTALLALELELNGGIHYAPYNMYSETNSNPGGSVSTENTVSVLGGLRMLSTITSANPTAYDPSVVANINSLMDSITRYLKASYSPELGYFRQGGIYDYRDGSWTWTDTFASDCQTWAITVLGVEVVDSWFGAGASAEIWKVTKQISGYNYNAATGEADGIGFSDNQQEQVFSGEWTLGAVNMLRTFAAYYSSTGQSAEHFEALAEANHMFAQVKAQLTSTFTYTADGTQATGILYANKRYYIPFGWWANPIPSVASTGWAVMLEENYNPFVLGGGALPSPYWNTNV